MVPNGPAVKLVAVYIGLACVFAKAYQGAEWLYHDEIL